MVKTRTIIGGSFLIFGFLLMGLGVIFTIGHHINFNLFFKILFLSLGIMTVGALTRGFLNALKLLIGFSVTFVIIIVMISTLLPVFLSMFSGIEAIQFIIEIIFGIIYRAILIAYLIRLAKISFKDAEPSAIKESNSSTIKDIKPSTVPIN